MQEERKLPRNLVAERAILGSILVNNENFHKVAEKLTHADFYLVKHGIIFNQMVALDERPSPIDLITMQSALHQQGKLEDIGGTHYLASLMEGVPQLIHIDHYIELVKEAAGLRKMIEAASRIVSECFDHSDDVATIFGRAQASVLDVTQAIVKGAPVRLSELAIPTTRLFEQLYANRQIVTGIASGFLEVDRLTAGFQPGDLVILAARPSHGKTAMALNIARFAAMHSHKMVLVFSLEMSKEQLMIRMVASDAMIDLNKIRTGYLSSQDFTRLIESVDRCAEASILIDDTSLLTMMELRAKSQKVRATQGLDLIVIDYLQLMSGPDNSENRNQEVSAISRGLKALAKELGVPVIALSQLSRRLEQREEKRPQLSDLRESGSIEQDADLVMFIHREEMFSPSDENAGLAEVVIGKSRNGPTGIAKLVFLKEFTKFENLAQVL